MLKVGAPSRLDLLLPAGRNSAVPPPRRSELSEPAPLGVNGGLGLLLSDLRQPISHSFGLVLTLIEADRIAYLGASEMR